MCWTTVFEERVPLQDGYTYEGMEPHLHFEARLDTENHLLLIERSAYLPDDVDDDVIDALADGSSFRRLEVTREYRDGSDGRLLRRLAKLSDSTREEMLKDLSGYRQWQAEMCSNREYGTQF